MSVPSALLRSLTEGPAHELAVNLVILLALFGIAVGRIPRLRMNRAGIAFAGAAALIALGAISAEEASASIDLGTLILILSMMIITANLKLSGFFDLAAAAVLRTAGSPKRLLALVMTASAVLSALFLNDTICIMFTPFVALLCLRSRRDPVPYLIALALAANIGSAATIIGNPQNMLIGAAGGITFLRFLVRMAPPSILGTAAAYLVVLAVFRREFFGRRATTAGLGAAVLVPTVSPTVSPTVAQLPYTHPSWAPTAVKPPLTEIRASPDGGFAVKPPATEVRDSQDGGFAEGDVPVVKPPAAGPNAPAGAAQAASSVEPQGPEGRVYKPLLYKSLAAVALMTAAFLMDAPVFAAAMAGAALLLVTRRVKSERVFAELDWTIIAFFGGLFIITAAVARTPAFAFLVDRGLPAVGQSMARFSVFTLILSNLVSNVPAVMLLRPLAEHFADAEKAWLVMAMAATYAGNLTLLGSVANLIVAEIAGRYGITVSFRAYLAAGLPVTLVTTAIGVAWFALT